MRELGMSPAMRLAVCCAALTFAACEEALVRPLEPSTLSDPRPEVVVSDQIPEEDRQELIIERAIVDEPGWAAVYAGACLGDDGEPAYFDLLGVEPLASSVYDTATEGATANTNESTRVRLSRAAGDFEALCLVLHRDRGTLNMFDFEPLDDAFSYGGKTGADKPFIRNDLPVMATVRALVASGLSAMSAQDIDPDEPGVVVTSLSSNGPGWAIVLERACEEGGRVIGARWVNAGTHEDVVIRLEAAPEDGAEVCVRLHADEPLDTVFTHDKLEGSDPITSDMAGDAIQMNISLRLDGAE